MLDSILAGFPARINSFKSTNPATANIMAHLIMLLNLKLASHSPKAEPINRPNTRLCSNLQDKK